MLFTAQVFGQISGNITDNKTELPVDFVNVWVKNTLKGTTTDVNGNFEFQNAKVGDTLLISYLGYEELEFSAKKENVVRLTPTSIELGEVMIIPIRNELEVSELTRFRLAF